MPQHVIQRERGDYGYSKLEKFLHDDVPDNIAQRNLGTTQYYGNNWAANLYGQDDFHLRHNLTINIGLRWERTTVPQTMKLQALNAISSVPGLIEFREPKAGNKAIAPRIGFAYSPGTSGNTSIRAGFGMAYDVVYDNVGTSSYPPQLSATINANSFPAIFTAPFLANGGIRPIHDYILDSAHPRGPFAQKFEDHQVVFFGQPLPHKFARNANRDHTLFLA